MAEGDTNLTNLVLSGDLTADDDATVTGDLTVTGAQTLTGVTTHANIVTGATALYCGASSDPRSFACGITWNGALPLQVAYIRLYDFGTGAYRNCWLNSGTLTAI